MILVPAGGMPPPMPMASAPAHGMPMDPMAGAPPTFDFAGAGAWPQAAQPQLAGYQDPYVAAYPDAGGYGAAPKGGAPPPRATPYGAPTGMPKQGLNNPGLFPGHEIFDGVMKNRVNPETNYGFVQSDAVMAAYGRDAFLHAKNCPFIIEEQYQRGEAVKFNLGLNEKGQPQVTAIIRG